MQNWRKWPAQRDLHGNLPMMHAKLLNSCCYCCCVLMAITLKITINKAFNRDKGIVFLWNKNIFIAPYCLSSHACVYFLLRQLLAPSIWWELNWETMTLCACRCDAQPPFDYYFSALEVSKGKKVCVYVRWSQNIYWISFMTPRRLFIYFQQ